MRNCIQNAVFSGSSTVSLMHKTTGCTSTKKTHGSTPFQTMHKAYRKTQRQGDCDGAWRFSKVMVISVMNEMEFTSLAS